MKRTLKLPAILLLVIFSLLFPISGNGQSWLEKQKKKLETEVDKKTDDIINGKKKKNTAGVGSAGETPPTTRNNDDAQKNKKGSSEQSIIKETDFVQNDVFAARNANDTRFKIADNLKIDIRGKYPVGYAPKWRFVFEKSSLTFDVENYVVKRADLGHENFMIALTSYKGKAVLRFGAFINAALYADIIIKDSLAVISQTPQTFKLTNFQQIINERPSGQRFVSTNNRYFAGGFEGEISLSANEDGDIVMDLLIESFKGASRFSEAGVSYRYIAKNVNIENQMSAEKANGIIAAELEAKKKYADYVKKSEKQISELMTVIKTKYPGYNCISCFDRTSSYGADPTTTKTLWSNGEVTEDYDLNVTNTMKIENKCNQELTFIGIQQLYDDVHGYTYKDVTRTMEAKYYYKVKEGLFMSMFTSVAGIDGDIRVYPEYNLSAARVGAIQWVRVIGKKKP